MKWLFLINNALFLSEFFGKLADEAIKQGDDCLVVWNSKVAEYGKKKFFPKEARFISKIDWCIENYKPDQKKFGDLSWKELFSAFDRINSTNFNYDNSLKMVSHLYQFFEFIFQKEKPDIIISELLTDLFHETAYYFCKTNNVPFLGLGNSIFDDRIEIFDPKFYLKNEKNFKEIKDEDISEKEKKFAKNFIEKFISHKYSPSYVGLGRFHLSQFEIIKHYLEKLKTDSSWTWQYLKKRKYFKDIDYESEARMKRSFSAPLRMEKRQFRILFQQNVFSKISNNDNFFLYPLQYQPEASTSVWATYYSDQLSTIKNIAFALPLPYKLYVKEHIASIGLRKNSFYKKLQKIPNAVLISSSENVENLVRRSSGVITLNGTIGMEAVLAGKIAYVLGTASYSYHPLCRKVKNFEELKNKIQNDLVNKPNIDNLEDINCRFITSCFRNTIKGNIVLTSREKDTNDYKLIYQKLKFYAISKLS